MPKIPISVLFGIVLNIRKFVFRNCFGFRISRFEIRDLWPDITHHPIAPMLLHLGQSLYESSLSQIMCRAVAVATFRKLLEHFVRMRLAVTRCTRWYGFMLIPMAISTGKIVVFCRICLKQGPGFLMTCRAVMRWGLSDVSDFKRLMNRMAGLAGLKVLVFGVFFMAFHTNGDPPVDIMAPITSHLCLMSAGMLFYLFTLLLVTCETRSGNVAL